MHIEVERQMRSAHEPLRIVAGGEIWDLYVFGVTRVARDWWVQIAAVGPRSCTVTVRVDSSRGRAAAAREIIRLVTDWLIEDETGEHVLLEHTPLEARAS